MWESLKKILQDSNERVVIVEDGQPRYVLLSIDEYMRLKTTNRTESLASYSNNKSASPQGYTATESSQESPSGTLESPIGTVASSYESPMRLPVRAPTQTGIRSEEADDQFSTPPPPSSEKSDETGSSGGINLEDLPF